jgi:hypothetical protein
MREISADAGISPRKRRAATIGPTVCELDGPIPTRNRSNMPIQGNMVSDIGVPASENGK